MTAWSNHSPALIIVFFALTLVASHSRAESEEELKAIERAHIAVTEVEESYHHALDEALKQGELKKALPGCHIKDLKRGDVTVGRTSHRLRNAKNLSPAWAKPYLEKFSHSKPSEIPKHVIVKLADHRYGYLQPIFVQPICLKCHGRYLTAEVKEAIQASYPKDQAVDFDLGDFRGLLWLEMRSSQK